MKRACANIPSIAKRSRLIFTVNLLADELITHEEYQDSIEINNNELTQLLQSKDELLSLLKDEKVIGNIEKLKQELLHFLDFDELTPEVLHRLIDRIEVKQDGTPIIHYRFSAPTFE